MTGGLPKSPTIYTTSTSSKWSSESKCPIEKQTRFSQDTLSTHCTLDPPSRILVYETNFFTVVRFLAFIFGHACRLFYTIFISAYCYFGKYYPPMFNSIFAFLNLFLIAAAFETQKKVVFVFAIFVELTTIFGLGIFICMLHSDLFPSVYLSDIAESQSRLIPRYNTYDLQPLYVTFAVNFLFQALFLYPLLQGLFGYPLFPKRPKNRFIRCFHAVEGYLTVSILVVVLLVFCMYTANLLNLQNCRHKTYCARKPFFFVPHAMEMQTYKEGEGRSKTDDIYMMPVPWDSSKDRKVDPNAFGFYKSGLLNYVNIDNYTTGLFQNHTWNNTELVKLP